MKDTLFTEDNLNPNVDNTKPVIRTALEIIDQYTNYSSDKFAQLDKIQDMIDETFEVSEPNGLQQINNFLMQQVLFTFVARTKPLDVQLRSDGIDDDTRRVVSEGVGYILKEGGFSSMLRDGFGGFYKQYAFGDFFGMIGTDEKGLPEFRDCSLTNIYFDSQATRLISKTGNKATRCVVVYEYSWDNAIKLFSGLEEKASMGPLPSLDNFDNILNEQSYEQQSQSKDRMVEVGFYYDITKEARFTTFAGPSAAILEDIKGEDYPFFFDTNGKRENYLPVLQWMCHPTNEGILNAGYGHIIYNISREMQEMANSVIKYGKDNLNPISFLNMPYAQAGSVMGKIANASKINKAGGRGIVVNGFKDGEKQAGLGQMDTLQTPAFSGEFDRIMEYLDKQLQRFGIKLDLTFTDPRKPFATTALEQESFGEVIQQIQEQNTMTYELVFKIAIDYIKKNISDDDKTPLPIQGIVKTEGGNEVETGGLTLGDLAQELKANNYQVVVNSRTGVVNTNTLEKFYSTNAIQDLLAIGDTAGARKLIEKKHKMNGINIGNQADQPQPGQQAQPGKTPNIPNLDSTQQPQL